MKMPMIAMAQATLMSIQISALMFYRSITCFFEYARAAILEQISTIALNSISEQKPLRNLGS